ncbi:MAG: aspartate/glutamate racemase family protein [Alphaproteobacteria bacterium]|jgi:allantoin racemase|nr:aspartate/glutamate racemase family protein [Alphaproteobacteria bacterium]
MIKIRVIFVGPEIEGKSFRKLEDLLPYQDLGVELSLSNNPFGPIHGQNDIEHSLGRAGMSLAAIEAERDGVDAIVIDSMGDTGLFECREAVTIPVVGMGDSSFRVAQMLGRKFGLITAGKWHGYALERTMKSYGIFSQFVGFEALNLQPFTDFEDSNTSLNQAIISAMNKLIDQDADTIVLGGSYFIGQEKNLSTLLADEKYKDLVVIDPLPLAIRFARMLVDAKLSQSKRIYATPTHATPVIGYPLIQSTPGVAA